MENLFLTIVNMSITATWAVLAFTLLRPLLKRVPKWISCFLWGVVGLRLCLPFSFESVYSLIPTTETIPSDITMSKTPQIDTGVGIVNDVVNPVISESFTPDPSYSANPLQVVVGVASYIWIVGVVLMVLYSIVSYIILKKKVSASVHYNNNIYYCDNIETPFILGVIKPKIYIPSGVNESDLEFIIEHEKSHLKRKDYLIKPFSFLLLSVYWFNPAIWLWYILLCRDIESACDEKAIKFYDNEYKKLYSTALLNCSTQKRIIMACPVAFGETGVKQRIKSVLNYKHPAVWVISGVTVIAIWLTIFFVTNPQQIDFKNVIDEKGYEITDIKITSISVDTVADNILNCMPDDKHYNKPRFKISERDNMIFFLNKVDLSDDKNYLFLTFSVEYKNLNDEGVLYSTYYKNDSGYSYFYNLGDKISFYSLTGDTGECFGEIISLGPANEFVVKLSKNWLERSKDSKIDIEIKMGEISYKQNDKNSENSDVKDNNSLGNESFLDINGRFNFLKEYNVFNPENTVAIKVLTFPENSEYQKVITDPDVIKKLHDIISNEIYSTKASKVNAKELPALHGMAIILQDYQIYNSDPLSYCFDEHSLLGTRYYTPDGCYEIDYEQFEEIEKLILDASDDTSVNLTPLVNPEDIIEQYDMGEYNVSLSSDWYYDNDNKTFINEKKNQTLKVERKFYAFSDYYDILKDEYDSALKTLGKENVSWSEEKLGFTDEIGVSNECVYIKKEPKGATAKIFFIYSNNLFVITIFDANGGTTFESFKELAYKVDFLDKTISGGSARASKKQETTEAVTDATTGNLKLVTSDTPPENTTSPEGYTTHYVDYFTPEGEHVYEYYVTE